jgi:hypothetical protein
MKETIATIGIVGVLATGGVFVADNKINPYTDKGDYFETSISDNSVKVDKYTNEVQLTRWEEVESISVKPIGDYLPSTRDILSDVREAESLDGKSTFIIEPSGNSINLDTILKERPEKNGNEYQQFHYNIIGCEDYDFMYQPPLSEEEIAEGDVRPDDIVGSYAVYHKSLKDNEFETGKAFHIKRPVISDSDKNWIWGELGFEPKTCTLTVYVAHEFLDNAVYPVRVDPTLGYTSMGGSNSTVLLNTIATTYATSTENGTVTSISLGIDGNTVGTVNAKGVIYDNTQNNNALITDGVSPSTLLPASASGSFTTIAYSVSPSITIGTGYSIGFVGDATVRYYYDSPGGTQGWSDPTNSYTSPQTTGNTNFQTRKISQYINYSVSGGTVSSDSVGSTNMVNVLLFDN